MTSIALSEPRYEQTLFSKVREHESAAEGGDIAAMVKLARILFSDTGKENPLPETYHSAYYWFAKAQKLSLEKFSSSADLHLDMSGDGITKNILDWLQKEVNGEGDDKYDHEHHEGLHYLFWNMLKYRVGTKGTEGLELIEVEMGATELGATDEYFYHVGDIPKNQHVLDAMFESMN